MTKLSTAGLFNYRAKIREIPNRKLKWTPSHNFVFQQTLFTAWLDVTIGGWHQKAKSVKVMKTEDYYDYNTSVEQSEEILKSMGAYERISYFEDFLENKLKIDRELFQREVHAACVAITAHLIVGQEWNFVGKEFFKKKL